MPMRLANATALETAGEHRALPVLHDREHFLVRALHRPARLLHHGLRLREIEQVRIFHRTSPLARGFCLDEISRRNRRLPQDPLSRRARSAFSWFESYQAASASL